MASDLGVAVPGEHGCPPATSLICRRLPRASITSIPVQSAADWSILGVSEHEKNASLGSGVSDNTADHFTGERPVSRVRPNPEAYRNIQVNFCKRPGCPHFCVEPLVGCIGPGRRSGSDGYRLVGARAESALRCSYCGVESRIKSNRAIHQEFRRQAAALFAPSPLICPTEGCLSDPRHPTKAFQKFGKSTAGALRFRCRSCKATFSVPGSSAIEFWSSSADGFWPTPRSLNPTVAPTELGDLAWTGKPKWICSSNFVGSMSSGSARSRVLPRSSVEFIPIYNLMRI